MNSEVLVSFQEDDDAFAFGRGSRAAGPTAGDGVALTPLIAGVRRIVRAEPNARRTSRAVADFLRPFLDDEDLLTPAQLEPDPNNYRQHVLHVEADGSFSIAALVWLPGQATAIHDHVSWCVVGVYRGAEYETRYELRQWASGPRLVELGRELHPTGFVEALTPPGDIHYVANSGPGIAVSLHIYGADLHALGSSVRRKYDVLVAHD